VSPLQTSKKGSTNLKEGSQTSQQSIINTAFKVFNNRHEEAKQLRDKNTHTEYQMLASTLQNQN
jgi:hypothetical protein